MHRISLSACGLATSTLLVLAVSPQPASATFPPAEGKANGVAHLEVPVSDTTSTVVEVAIATAFGTSIAMALRRRPPGSSPGGITVQPLEEDLSTTEADVVTF